MFCAVCGSHIQAGPTHCPLCGATLPSSASQPSNASVTVTDEGLARSLGGDILVGRAFAFVAKTALQKPGLGWIQRLLGGGRAPRPLVISLFDRQPVLLPGATMSRPALPALSLAAVTSDKALYREGRDEVHLLALDPLAAGAEAVLEIKANGAELARRSARLDARGAASLALRDLPPGDYEVRFRGAPASSPACSFTVAAYRLAPLVASLVDRRLDGPRLAMTLRLESFGRPTSGKVQLELTDRGARLTSLVVEAHDGVVAASFDLTGAGPHAINVQLVSDPARTATVPIVGSRAAERSRTLFSPLGAEVTGSLLPSRGSQPVRGIHLEEGAFRTSPFHLESVAVDRARLTAVTAVETVRIVIVDPTRPLRRPGAVDPATATHPALVDEGYKRGEALFAEGKIAESLAAFEAALAEQATPHPNYAYFIACCHARSGDVARGITALEAAIRDGWTDLEFLRKDEDLAALCAHPSYAALFEGPREIALDDVAAGQVIELDVPGPMALVALGAWIAGEAWEGWATVITRETIAPSLTAPSNAEPGRDATITIDTGRANDDASVYVVIKDARLLTPDTPASRLAAGLKDFAEAAGKELVVGAPKQTLASLIPVPSWHHKRGGIAHPIWAAAPGTYSVPPPETSDYGPPPAPRGFGPPRPPPAYGSPAPGGSGPPPMPASAGPPPGFGEVMNYEASDADFRELSAPLALMAAPMLAAPVPPGAPPLAAVSPYRVGSSPPPPPSLDEPEVLFAGLVATQGGRASISVRLGGDFADYLVEAFVIAGSDWAPVEARFRAQKELFVSLDVPAFVHPQDGAIGRVHVGARNEGARVRVTCDGADVPLVLEGLTLAPGAPLYSLTGGRTELSFLAAPGRWEAVIEDPSGARDSVTKDVEIPGKIRRIARAVRFLQPGERVSRDDDAAILGLRVLPGLDKPFRALVDATADYGHACCEQTAAKMLAAAAMYALADDSERRSRAEAILLAGVRREETMWLRGRGFKMYPESSSQPDTYWGPLAARHLQSLAILRDLRGPAAPGHALSKAISEALAMADDASRAYGFTWPPTTPRTCEEAYATICFGPESARPSALTLIKHLAGQAASSRAGGAVHMRAESAYAAAALFRAGGPSARALALSLANAVIGSLGENGRLYSTVDSVAAIALMVELRAAQIVGGAGIAAIDGARLSTREAVDYAGTIREVEAIEGVIAVEVARVVEEDWEQFNAKLPLRVAIEKSGGPTRRVEALAAVDLVVKIETGYVVGDLCWVCLPDALSRVVGGGQVKRFSVDFQGRDEVRIPLAATGVTVSREGKEAPAHFAVCVRNMFEEERGGNPGALSVTVLTPAG
jgi:hypothetical protein